MKRFSAKNIALGGVLSAMAQVIMGLGTMIPFATYICPVLCMLILCVYHRIAGRKAAWTWYIATSLVSLLLSPDKEASAMLVFFGYYPIVKPVLEGKALGWFYKFTVFNISILTMYGLLIYVFAMTQVAAEFQEMGTVMTIATLLLGNVTFFVLDRLLTILFRRRI